jgi:phosphoglycolate phosphatase
MMAIKGILFDKDGTLIDVNGTWVPFYKYLLAQEFGASEQEAEAMMEKAGYEPAGKRFLPGSVLASGTTQQLVEIWWQNDTPAQQKRTGERLDRDYAPVARKFVKPLFDLTPLLRELKHSGFFLGVGTNDSEISARGHIEALGVRDFFDVVIGADSVPVPKPSGDMVRFFASLAGLACAEVAMVGDNAHDIEEARNGGAGLAVAVLTGNSDRQHVEHLADHVLDSVTALPRLLRRG